MSNTRRQRNRKLVGWVYREDSQPPYIVVTGLANNQRNAFPDDADGATAVASFITDQLGRDDWKLENMEFLGYRIVIPLEDLKARKQKQRRINGIKKSHGSA